MVGEKAVSLALGGRAWPELVVEMGVRPRRDAPPVHTLLCAGGRVPDCPEPVGLLLAVGAAEGGLLAAEEGGRWLIETAHASESVLADVVGARRGCTWWVKERDAAVSVSPKFS